MKTLLWITGSLSLLSGLAVVMSCSDSTQAAPTASTDAGADGGGGDCVSDVNACSAATAGCVPFDNKRVPANVPPVP